VGGLLSEMTGGDFATGALAAGANEALVGEMNKWFKGNPELLLMGSQIVGVLSATALGNTDQESLENASWVANNATQYNFLNHRDVKDLEKALKECKDNCDAVRAEFAKRDADNTARLNNCWATGDCAQIKAEIDEGSLALNKLWENDESGITDQFLHSNIADSTNARTRAVLDHLPKGDPANAVKLLAAAGIIALAPEAIGLLGQLATRGAASCAANPVLCANEVAIWTAEAGVSEALPVGLGAAAGGLTAKELSDLRGLMEIEAKTGAKLTAEQIAAVVGQAATGAKGVSGSALTRDELISGLPVGTKITPRSVVDIRRLPDGRTVWLEKGTDAAGLQHIYKRHEADFVNKGISRDDIPNVVMNALERGKVVGTNGSANVYRITHNGVEQNIAVGVGSNGFVVRANPVSSWKLLP